MKSRVLIVDDNEAVLTTYRIVLERMGYEVIEAFNGRECLARIEKKLPDLVLLDVLLPGLSGSEVCRLIKETALTKDIPVVAITASMSRSTRDAPNGSSSWANTGGGVSGLSVPALNYEGTHGVLYAATYSNGVWRCDNPGAGQPSWVDTKGSLATHSVLSFASDGARGAAYAGTDNMGAWYAAYPAVASCAPSSAERGETLNVDIVGKNTNFAGWTSKASFGAGITVNSLSVTDATHARANITVSPDASSGGRDVNVTTGGEVPNVLRGGFAVTVPGQFPNWYLAEGTSDWGFETYVTIENPNATPVTAQVTYMTKDGPKGRPDITLPALSQTVVNPREDLGATDFSTRVSCRQGKTIAVDRRMIWTGPGAASPEGHSSIGVTAPSKTWYLPEGSSDWGFECWLLVQNPNSSPAQMTFTYMIEGEGPKQVTRRVGANARASFNMADDLGAKDASVKISSPVPVIAERAMYRNNRREGHDSIGTVSPAYSYYLAEGTTNWGFTTYVLIQNPNSTSAGVTLTFMTPEGPKPQAPFNMPGNSRKTIRVNDVLPLTDFSTLVQGSRPVIAERAMYWNTASGEACHDSIGMASPHATFYLPDGETHNNTETWTLVQNPNSTEVTVEVSYLTPDGKGNRSIADKIPANSRKTYFMGDTVPQGRAAIMVASKTSGKKIMAERAMYWNARGAGTDTIGGYSD